MGRAKGVGGGGTGIACTTAMHNGQELLGAWLQDTETRWAKTRG